MPVLLALLGFFFPRIVLFFVWFFAPGAVEHVFGGNLLLLLLGWIFLPLGTLVYAFVFDPIAGGVEGMGMVAVVVAVLLDLGVVGRSARYRT